MNESMESILAGANTPAKEETPARIVDEPENAIGTELVEGQPHKDEVEPKADDGGGEPNGRIPVGAIRQAEREKGNKRYTEAVSDFERKLAETDARWEQRFTQLYGALAAKPQAQAEQQAKPDFWDNPELATQHAVQPIIGRVERALMANSELVAKSVHGADRVQEAERAFLQAYQTGQIDPADAERVVSAHNRWDAAVQWHKRLVAQNEIGDDPAAYRERVKAEIIAEIQKTGRVPEAAVSAAPTQSVMPSNLADVRNAGSRTSTTFAGPPSIGDILAAKQRSIFKA